jgi:hypothetical protein
MPRLTDARFQDNFPGSDYSDEEREFLMAIDRYKRERRRVHLSWREVLVIAKSLGYRRVAEAMPVPRRTMRPAEFPTPTSP